MCNHYGPDDDPAEIEAALNMTLVRIGVRPAEALPGFEAFPKRKAPIIRKRNARAEYEWLR